MAEDNVQDGEGFLEDHKVEENESKSGIRKVKKKKDKRSRTRAMAPPSMVPPTMEPPPGFTGIAQLKATEGKHFVDGTMTSYDLEGNELSDSLGQPKDEFYDGNEGQQFHLNAKELPSPEISPGAKGIQPTQTTINRRRHTEQSEALMYQNDVPVESESKTVGTSFSAEFGGLGSAGPLPGGTSAQSRARVLAQQRELQLKRRQQAMCGNQAMMRSTEGVPSGVTPAMRQFGAQLRTSDIYGSGTGIHDGSTLAPDNGSYENPASQTNTGPRVDTLRLASPSTHNFGLDVDESTICTDDARASRKSGKLPFLGYLQ
jgi:hypothetical protein